MSLLFQQLHGNKELANLYFDAKLIINLDFIYNSPAPRLTIAMDLYNHGIEFKPEDSKAPVYRLDHYSE